jgi:hypothetical protein
MCEIIFPVGFEGRDWLDGLLIDVDIGVQKDGI